MVKFLFSLLFSLSSILLKAQNSEIDSLQLLELQMRYSVDSLEAEVSREKEDTSKIGLLGYLCYYYAWVNPEKSLKLGMQGLELSRRINFKRGTAYCHQSLSFCLWVLGNFSESLKLSLKSLQEYENLKDYRRAAYSHLAAANVYREIGDYKRGIREAQEGIRIYNSIGFSKKVAYVVAGSVYERSNQLDSALQYMQMAYEMDLIENNAKWGFIVYVLGNIHAKLQHYEVALAYYRMALPLVIKKSANKDVVDVYNSLAGVFYIEGKSDSSIYYANEILQNWKGTNYKQGFLQAANTLAAVYKEKNQRDSVIKYLEMGVALNKELFTQEKEREVQNLAFNEQMRRREKEQMIIIEAEERKRNLQLLFITAFIISFTLGVIIISRLKTFAKTARFLGLIWVLLIFEFISLLTHPWIEKITKHSPVFTLLLLVLLAAVLVPAHHYLEDMIRKKMVKKRKRKARVVAPSK